MSSKKIDYLEDKTISVIVPLLNAEKTIYRALNSIKILEIPNLIEVIIIDDKSIDNSYNLFRYYKFIFIRKYYFIY